MPEMKKPMQPNKNKTLIIAGSVIGGLVLIVALVLILQRPPKTPPKMIDGKKFYAAAYVDELEAEFSKSYEPADPKVFERLQNLSDAELKAVADEYELGKPKTMRQKLIEYKNTLLSSYMPFGGYLSDSEKTKTIIEKIINRLTQ